MAERSTGTVTCRPLPPPMSSSLSSDCHCLVQPLHHRRLPPSLDQWEAIVQPCGSGGGDVIATRHSPESDAVGAGGGPHTCETPPQKLQSLRPGRRSGDFVRGAASTRQGTEESTRVGRSGEKDPEADATGPLGVDLPAGQLRDADVALTTALASLAYGPAPPIGSTEEMSAHPHSALISVKEVEHAGKCTAAVPRLLPSSATHRDLSPIVGGTDMTGGDTTKAVPVLQRPSFSRGVLRDLGPASVPRSLVQRHIPTLFPVRPPNSAPPSGEHPLPIGGVACRMAHRPEPAACHAIFRRHICDAPPCTASPAQAAPSIDRPRASSLRQPSPTTKTTTASSLAVPPSPPGPSSAKEMQRFVLRQYRALQRDVAAPPQAAPPSTSAEGEGVSSTIHHVRKKTCPRHSVAASALLQREEEQRLRRLQKQHHDMKLISNGGREWVAANMKSTVALANSLSKLRERNRSALRNSTDPPPLRGSMESTSSLTGSLHNDGQASLSGLSESYRPSTAPNFVRASSAARLEARSALSEPEAELPGAAASFAASNGSWAGRSENPRQSRPNMNKNGMKGAHILVAVPRDSDSDSDDDDDETERRARSECWQRLQQEEGRKGRNGGGSVFYSTALRDIPEDDAESSVSQLAGERLKSKLHSRTAAQSSSSRDAAWRSHAGEDSSSEDEVCFSFDRQRSHRVWSVGSPTSKSSWASTATTPGKRESTRRASSSTHIATPPSVDLLRSSKISRVCPTPNSPADDRDDSDENGCCHCCPCRRPENFIALCMERSLRSRSMPQFEAAQEAAPTTPTRRWDKDKDHREVTAAAVEQLHWKSSRYLRTSSPTAKVDKAQDSEKDAATAVVMENLEDEEEEAMLSMQHFKRPNIQRIR